MNCLRCGVPVSLEKASRAKYSCGACGLLYEGEMESGCEVGVARFVEAAYIGNRMFPWVVVPLGTLVVLDSKEVV